MRRRRGRAAYLPGNSQLAGNPGARSEIDIKDQAARISIDRAIDFVT
ncbi:hypothetical protein AB9E15_08675 [Rhizobium leguminosarum]